MSGTAVRAVMPALLLTVLLIGSVPGSLAAQTTIYVDDAAPGDPGPGDPLVSDPLEDGSLDHPYDAIQEGIAAAVNGDEVVVGPDLPDGDTAGAEPLASALRAEIVVRPLDGPACGIGRVDRPP